MKPSFLLLSTESLAAVLHDQYYLHKEGVQSFQVWQGKVQEMLLGIPQVVQECQQWRCIAEVVIKKLPDLIQALPSSEQRLCMERAASLQPLNLEPPLKNPSGAVKGETDSGSSLAWQTLDEVRQIMGLHLEQSIPHIEVIGRILQLLDRPDVVQMLTTKPAKVHPETAEAFEAYKATAEAKIDELSNQVTELTKKLAEISAIAGL